jgi:hypothetical protein
MPVAAEVAAQIAADNVTMIRAKRDAGKRLTAKESAIISKANADEASARLAAQPHRLKRSSNKRRMHCCGNNKRSPTGNVWRPVLLPPILWRYLSGHSGAASRQV